MPDIAQQTSGWRGYMQAATEVADSSGAYRYPVLLRMLAAKGFFGLSAQEYGLFGLQQTPFWRLYHYRTKKQTTAIFSRINAVKAKPQVEDKLLFHRICAQAGLPTPKLHALLCSRKPDDVDDFPVLTDFASVAAHFSAYPEIRLILKPRRDALGTGVRFVCFRRGQAYDIDDNLIDVQPFAEALHFDMLRDDYLIQGFVTPNPRLERLGSGRALGTLRIATYLNKKSEFFMLYALLRIPARGNVHDNFSGGSSGNLIAPIDLRTGRIGRAWGRRDPNLSRVLEPFQRNPDTGVVIRGESVPDWGDVCAMIQRASRTFADLPLLGWDIAISAEGLVLIEANSNPDIIGAQVCTGLGARELLRPLWSD